MSLSSFYQEGRIVLPDKKTVRFVIRDFRNLQHNPGEYVESHIVRVHGHPFGMRVYPRGKTSISYVDCWLFYDDSSERNPVKANLTFYSPGCKTENFTNEYTSKEKYGKERDLSRSHVLEKCLDSEGNFILHVDIQVYFEKKPVWYPKMNKIVDKKRSFGRMFLESDLESDFIYLLVGEGREKIPALRSCLLHQAPGLYELIKDVPQGKNFDIPSVTVPAFKILLEYVNTGDVPQDLIKLDDGGDLVKGVLLNANKFGLVHLKLYMESEIISKFLKVGNAAEWLSFADANVCPYLKEHCMDMYLEDTVKFESSSGWERIKESAKLLAELLKYTRDSLSVTVVVVGESDDKYKCMSVGILREELESNDLDLDGTKEMLIQRLEYNDKNKNELPATASSDDNGN